MEKENLAIRISGVKKEYRLGSIGGRTLQADLQSWFARERGREDPNVKIGQDERLVGQKFMALNGIDLTICQGEMCGIIGSNGAGKSTLLKLLAQVTAPTEGEIDLYGRVTPMLEVGTGFNGEMTGRENIYMNGTILGMSKAEIRSKMEQIIEFSEVREFIDTPVKRYSSGMFVKLAFSVAAHLDSEIMIMDEVLAVGDMAFQKKCLDKMREVAQKENRTVLYVSHNMNTIRRLCDRCIVLDQGKVIYDGEVEGAIAVYMDHAVGENETDMDLAEKQRAARILNLQRNQGLFMEHLTMKGKITPVFAREETLDLRIRVRTTQPLKNVMFRLTLRTDSDSGLGTFWSEPVDFPVTGEQDVKMSMPLQLFEKGIFYASIGFYQKTAGGEPRILDHITRAFKIEIPGNAGWSTNAYGYLRFPEMKIQKNEERKKKGDQDE